MTTTNRREFLRASSFAMVGALASGGTASPAQQSPTSVGPLKPALVEDLVAANRILADNGILDAFGHVSVRHDRSPDRFVISRSVAPALVTSGDLIEYDLDGRGVNVKGRGEYSERFIHAEIYKARSDVSAVVHAHTPSLIPFGVGSVPLRPVYHMAGFIGEGVPIFDIRATAGMTDMLVKDAGKGRALAQALGNRPAVLMRGHGIAVVGPALPFAVGRSIYLDLNARIQMQALALGGSVTYLDPDEAQEIMKSGENRSYERAWELWKKKVSGR
jgi:ribulose-5-phosphate 4-epimerase/fuculose-1-phosphate aldolase